MEKTLSKHFVKYFERAMGVLIFLTIFSLYTFSVQGIASARIKEPDTVKNQKKIINFHLIKEIILKTL